MEGFTFESNKSYWELLVPTVDTVKIRNIILNHFESLRNVYITGNSGTGKSVLGINSLKQF